MGLSHALVLASFYTGISPGELRWNIPDFTVSIPASVASLDLTIYPNPTVNFINISSSEKIGKIAIYNQTGQLIWSGRNSKINVSSFSSGIYFIQLRVESGK